MNDLLTALLDPWQLPFMRRAFLAAVVAGIVCGVVGAYVVLRGMAFIGDAISHSVFPGVAAAYALHVNLALGGAVAGIATAVTVAVVAQNRRLKEDTLIGVFFAFAFGLGIVLVSTQRSYVGDLSSFLFGQLLAVSDTDLVIVVALGAVLVAAALLLRKELVTVILDRETATASGLPTFWLDVGLYLMVTIAIVVSLQAVGNILVLALLITPAATARLITNHVKMMMLLAAVIGAVGAVVGLYISYSLNLAAGGLIVMVLTAVFLVVYGASPRHGLVATLRRRLRTPERSSESRRTPGRVDRHAAG